jgi:hypothetical protein
MKKQVLGEMEKRVEEELRHEEKRKRHPSVVQLCVSDPL